MTAQTWAIVVHHESLGTLPETVRNLLAQGLDAQRIVVVDNSRESVKPDDVHRVLALPQGQTVIVLKTANLGYAAAVNHGFAHLRAEPVRPDAVLVITHEVLLDPGSLAELATGLNRHSRLGAVGPLLKVSGSNDQLWSTGGYLTAHLKIPQHHVQVPTEPTERVWLDGAAVLYRWGAVSDRSLSESYFLYLEEVDFHLELAATGWGVAIIPTASAWQESDGTPAFYAVRNIQIFQRRWGRRGYRTIAVILTVARTALAVVLGRRPGTASDVARGVRAGWRAT